MGGKIKGSRTHNKKKLTEVLIVFLCFIKKKKTKTAAQTTKTTTTSDPSAFSMIGSLLILLSIQLQFFQWTMKNKSSSQVRQKDFQIIYQYKYHRITQSFHKAI